MQAAGAAPSPAPASRKAAELLLKIEEGLCQDGGARSSSARCSFETFDAFEALERELQTGIEGANFTERHRISRSPAITYKSARDTDLHPLFKTAPRVPGPIDVKLEAARTNDAIRTLYRPPSEHKFRDVPSPATWQGFPKDFQAKFVLPNRQDVRSRIAADQEGFFGMADCEQLPPPSRQFLRLNSGNRSPSKSSTPSIPVQQPFTSSVGHTSRKSSNLELRLEKILDQDGLLPNLHDIRCHHFRDEASTPVPFHTTFKPAPSRQPIGQ